MTRLTLNRLRGAPRIRELPPMSRTLSTPVETLSPADSVVARRLNAYATLTKARLSTLVLVTTAVGYVLAAETAVTFGIGRFFATLIGTALAAASANALNQVLEAGRDAVMPRTRQRPLPSGELSARHAMAVAFACGAVGVFVLAAFVNPLAATLAFITIVLYVLVYTPLKSLTTLNTLVGAVCGAIPPMIGWAGADGRLGAGAWALGALLFVWQIPHFLALAWLYREDYAQGRYRMLPVLDPGGHLTCRIALLTSLMLVPVALTATLLGLAGWFFTIGACVLGAGMAIASTRLYLDRTRTNARRVFLASLVYLATVMVLLVLDRGPTTSSSVIERVAWAQR